jgi:two-component system chemotaxis response regulator CheY
MSKVWVIEDSRRVQEILKETVAGFGLDASAAAPSDELATLVGAGDVVFLDWDLPAGGALDALTAMACIPSGQRPFIVLMAIENDPSTFTMAKAAGANFYMLKPFDRADIVDVLIRCGCNIEAVA